MEESDSTVDLGEKGYSFKEIAMRVFKEAGDNLSKEFRGGFYLSDFKEGNKVSNYVDDTRDIASNSIYVLALLLIPKFDKEMKPLFKQFEKDLRKLKDDFIKATKTKEKVVLGQTFYKPEEDKLLLEHFKIEKLDLHIILFKNLSELLGRKNYLEMGGKSFE